MDVSKITKISPLSTAGGGEDARSQASSARDRQRTSATGSQTPDGASGSTSGSGSVTGATSRPDAGGVIASSGPETGQTRDPADPRQTQDRAPEAAAITARLRERFSALAAEARLPTNTRLSIDVDSDTNEARFRVVNKASGEVIREIPEKDFVDLLRRLETGERLVDDVF
jgi:uncharacterized FlaG/YvyC family protein